MVSLMLQTELKEILKTDYGFTLSQTELSEFSETLVSYFETLLKANKNKYEDENFRNRDY